MLIKNATIVNEGHSLKGSVLVEGDEIKAVFHEGDILPSDTDVVDAEGMYLLPGVVDDHVHMRDPGLTHKADMESETLAAAAGGVTSVMDMPNVNPQTTTIELWQQRMDYAQKHCHVNYAFYLGATNDNLDEIKKMDTHSIPALKLFMGSSTGGMLVDQENLLREIFRSCPTLIMTHCEATGRINQRMQEAQKLWGDDPDVIHHDWIRDDEACYESTSLAVRLAQETGARLHVAHITTAKELELLTQTRLSEEQEKSDGSQKEATDKWQDTAGNITAEVCPQHLFFCNEDYKTKGTLIKCNPAIKADTDRQALRKALQEGLINIIGTDHAPHLLCEKEGGARKAVSGMPLVQFSLPLMLTLATEGLCTMERIVEVMCHNPVRLFGIQKRGFIRPGYKADLVLVKSKEWKIRREDVLSKCGWSPLEGETLRWAVAKTWVNGQCVYDKDKGVEPNVYGKPLKFNA